MLRTWEKNKQDSRAQNVIDLINRHVLNVLNDSNFTPTYSSPIGTSLIDIIFYDNINGGSIENYKVWDDHSLSEHRLITFKTT